VKIYVAAVEALMEALREKERQGETQETIIDGFLIFPPPPFEC
jgi:hypothetical protein